MGGRGIAVERGWRSGPRLTPTGSPDPRPDIIEDPANGDRVPRCWCCGMPDQPDNRLTLFELRLRGRPGGRWQVCRNCYYRRNPPPVGIDPLDVSV